MRYLMKKMILLIMLVSFSAFPAMVMAEASETDKAKENTAERRTQQRRKKERKA